MKPTALAGKDPARQQVPTVTAKCGSTLGIWNPYISPFLRGGAVAFNRAHFPLNPYRSLCAGDVGVVGWATSNGRNFLIHTLAQLDFPTPAAPPIRIYTGCCHYIMGMLEREFACEPLAPMDCVLWWMRILLLLGLTPTEYSVCVFLYTEVGCVVLGSGAGALGVWYAMNHFSPLWRATPIRKYPRCRMPIRASGALLLLGGGGVRETCACGRRFRAPRDNATCATCATCRGNPRMGRPSRHAPTPMSPRDGHCASYAGGVPQDPKASAIYQAAVHTADTPE